MQETSHWASQSASAWEGVHHAVTREPGDLPAFAQTAVTTTTVATGDTASGDNIVVTASRSGDAIPIDLVGSSVTVIDMQDLQDRQTRILSDVLRDVPGVAVNRLGAVGGQTQVRIRGAEGNHTLVFIDGIKASDPYDGEYDFATLLADESARVEVLRGQQSHSMDQTRSAA
jgi:vitamin B12 transporter